MTNVYIVFGDVPRSDGDNIEAVFNTRYAAEDYVEALEWRTNNCVNYHIEEFEVFNDLTTIRCNECLYSDNVVSDEHGNEYLVCLYFKALMNRDGYCSQAERCIKP